MSIFSAATIYTYMTLSILLGAFFAFMGALLWAKLAAVSSVSSYHR